MSKKSKEIIVMHDLFLVRLLTKFVIIVLLIVTAYTVINQKINVALLVSVLIILIFPFTWGAVWLKTFKVIANERTIMVRKYWFEKEFSIADCVKVKHKIVDTNFMHSEKTCIVAKKCKFSVDSSMKNYKIFHNYIISNLPSEKIEIRKKDMRTKKK